MANFSTTQHPLNRTRGWYTDVTLIYNLFWMTSENMYFLCFVLCIWLRTSLKLIEHFGSRCWGTVLAQQKQDVCTTKSFSITYTKELTARAMVLIVYHLRWYLKCYMKRLCSIFKYRCIHPIMQNTICSLQRYLQPNQTGALPYSDTSPHNKYSFFKRHVVS